MAAFSVSMDQVNVVKPDIPLEILSAAVAIVENVVRESVVIFTSTQRAIKPCRGSILRKDVSAADCGRPCHASPGHRISWASDLNDGSERSWNQSSPESADSFPFAVHPRCENLIREDRNLTSEVHPYKNLERAADRFVRVPSPLSGDAERSRPASVSPAPEGIKYVVSGNSKNAVSESLASKSKVSNPKASSLQSLRQRLQSGPSKVGPQVKTFVLRET